MDIIPLKGPNRKTLRICAMVVVAVIAAYLLYRVYNVRMLTAYPTAYHQQKLWKKHAKLFHTTQKQRVTEYIQQMTRQEQIAPRRFDFKHSNVSMSLVQEFLLAAHYALLAYQTSEVQIQQGCETLGTTLVGAVSNGNVYAFVARSAVAGTGGVQILAIQGTEFVPGDHNIYEVWSDLSILPRFVEGRVSGAPTDMYVHSGFYDDMAALWPQISPLLDFGMPIWICAHSLGGVRASLVRYLIPSTTMVRITNFGAPKGANGTFWDTVMASNTRVERVLAANDFAGDWQPLLPYVQSTEEFYWLNGGTINLVKERDWLNISFSDHSILNSYLPRLTALVHQ